jgi:NADH-quinone oxidoreductase subunit J
MNPLLQWLLVIPAAAMLFMAAAAGVLRNLLYAALALILSFAALGFVFLALGAEFIGLVQLLVYVGAVSILIVFAILVTRPEEMRREKQPLFGWVAGVVCAFVVLGALLWFLFSSPLAALPMPPEAPSAEIAAIGRSLLTDYVPALLVTALLLTAALIGAVVLALEDPAP